MNSLFESVIDLRCSRFCVHAALHEPWPQEIDFLIAAK